MKVAVDTNVLVRAVMRDDPSQARAAARLLRESEAIAVSLSCLCEFVWVLIKVYGVPPPRVARSIRDLLVSANVLADRPAAEAGLAAMDAGGDFADGLIAYEGRWLGCEVFASFDKKAVALVVGQGHRAMIPR